MSLRKTGIIYDFQMNYHSNEGNVHPENPSRLHSLISHIESNFSNDKSIEIITSVAECDEKMITLVHSEDYLLRLKKFKFAKPEDSEDSHQILTYSNSNSNIEKKRNLYLPYQLWFNETYFNNYSLSSAKIAIQATLDAADRIIANKWKNAFSLIRPPGHHASLAPAGFCIFNNVAILCRYLQKKHNLQKILIFDWDVHHGDGTQSIFYDEKNVLVCSVHRYDYGNFYPFGENGDSSKLGEEKGLGFNLNVGWNVVDVNKNGENSNESCEKKRQEAYERVKKRTAGNNEYIFIFERILFPIFKVFNPEFVIISAGFDSAKGDPLGGTELTVDGYCYMTKRLMGLAEGRVLTVLEGGYNIENLCNCAEGVIRVLKNEELPVFNSQNKLTIEKTKDNININDVGLEAAGICIENFGKFWNVIHDDNELIELHDKMTKKYSVKKEQKLDLSGGHTENFKLINGRVVKYAKKPEILFYTEVYNPETKLFSPDEVINFKYFIPTFFGLHIDDTNKKIGIVLENLLNTKPYASMIDVKIGKKSYLDSSTPEKIISEKAKSEISISKSMGFRFTGIIIKDANGKIKMKTIKKECYIGIRKEDVDNIFKSFLRSNDKEEINREALDYFIKFVEKMIYFFRNVCNYKFIATSLFIVLDNISNSYDIKFIDFSYWEKTNGERDESCIEGLESLKNVFEKIRKE